MTDKRIATLQNLSSILIERSRFAKEKAVETMKSKANVDGPWQSKQPDEMIKIEVQAGIYQQQTVDFMTRAEEIHSLLKASHNYDGKVKIGSVLVWEMRDPDKGLREETVIITPSGGGEIENYRLLSQKAPLTKAILGKRAGDTIPFGDITVSIKKVI